MININTHKILINLLFKNRDVIENNIKLKKINYDDIVKLASSHLMIPALYVRLKENNLLKEISDELKEYLQYIYNQNKIRNNNLIQELNFLSKLYIKNNIDHVFLKGCAYIAYGRFNNLGERMVGDIDVLVSKLDYDKAIKLSKKYGYKKNLVPSFSSIHYPRLINPEKLFALEIHSKLLRKNNKLLNSERFLEGKQIKSNIFVPNKRDLILHTIYNEQLNDLGNLNASISYRSIYDIILYELEISELVKHKYSKYLKNYLLMSNYLKITSSNLKLNFFNILYLFRFKSNLKYKIFNVINSFVCRLIHVTPIRINKLYKLFVDQEYRAFLLKKISKIQ